MRKRLPVARLLPRAVAQILAVPHHDAAKLCGQFSATIGASIVDENEHVGVVRRNRRQRSLKGAFHIQARQDNRDFLSIDHARRMVGDVCVRAGGKESL